MRLVLATLLVAALFAGCGSEEPPATGGAPLADALPELDNRTRALDANALSDDAFDRSTLLQVLEQAGYVRGQEREFSGKSRTFDHVVARTLSFETPGGAEEYLSWLRGNAGDLLGRAAPADLSLPGESGIAFTLVPCGSCKKELPTFLAGWRREGTVFSLLAAGSGANERSFLTLARELDR